MVIGIWRAVVVGLALLTVFPALAQDEARIKELETRRARLVANIAEGEQMAAEAQGERKAGLEAQIKKWRENVATIDKQLAKLRGTPAPAAAPAAGEAAADAKPVDAATAKEMARIEREIKALLTRIQARAEKIRQTPKDELLPQVQAVPGGPGVVDPGAAAPPPGGPMAPGGPGAPGAPGDPAMMPGAEGAAVPAQPITVRGRLEQEQREDLARLDELQKKLAELKAGPQEVDPLAADNIPELNPLVLFGGSVEKSPHGLKIGSWGSGTVEENENGLAEGLKSLLVYTDGYYRGVRLDFGTAPDITKYFADPDRSYLQMDVVFFPKEQPAAAGGPMGEPGMAPGFEGAPALPPGMEMQPAPADPAMAGAPAAPMEPGMMPGAPPPGAPGAPGAPADPAMFPPGDPGAMPPGMPGEMMPGGPGAAPAVKAAPATRSLRVVLDTDRGPVVAEDVYFDHTYEVYPGWTRVFIPVSEFVLVNERAPSSLSRLRLFGDTKDAFYVGMVRLVADEVPITPTILGEASVAAVAAEMIKLEATVDAGLSVVDYVWDWGDGTTDETDEPAAEHVYIKPGDYTVTLTARDKDQLKPDGTATVKVVVKAFAEVPKAPVVQPGMAMPAPGR